MLRSKQQEKPSQDASTTSRSACRTAARSTAGPGEPPHPSRRGWGARGAGPRFPVQSSFPGPCSWAAWGRRRRAQASQGRAGQHHLIFVASCTSGGEAGPRRAQGGAAFHSRALASPTPSHRVALSGPSSPSRHATMPVSCKPEAGVCRPPRLSDQQPWGLTPTPRADIPELGGTQASLLLHEGAPGLPG